jgi:hypothetical protein
MLLCLESSGNPVVLRFFFFFLPASLTFGLSISGRVNNNAKTDKIYNSLSLRDDVVGCAPLYQDATDIFSHRDCVCTYVCELKTKFNK